MFHLRKLGLNYKNPIKSYLTSSEKETYALTQRLLTLNKIKERKIKENQEKFVKNLEEKKRKEEMMRKKRRREREKYEVEKKKYK